MEIADILSTMSIEDAISVVQYMRDAYQKLIIENVHEGMFVGTDVTGTWSADTPLNQVYAEHVEACEMALSALYKQQPMRPRKHVIKRVYMQEIAVIQCPTCDRRLRTRRTMAKGDQHCPDCGQKIDWSEQDE